MRIVEIDKLDNRLNKYIKTKIRKVEKIYKPIKDPKKQKGTLIDTYA